MPATIGGGVLATRCSKPLCTRGAKRISGKPVEVRGCTPKDPDPVPRPTEASRWSQISATKTQRQLHRKPEAGLRLMGHRVGRVGNRKLHEEQNRGNDVGSERKTVPPARAASAHLPRQRMRRTMGRTSTLPPWFCHGPPVMNPPTLPAASSDLPDAVARVAKSVRCRRSSVALSGVRRGLARERPRGRGGAPCLARAERMQVVLPDGESATAVVEGADATTDLALLAIEGETAAAPLPALERSAEDSGGRPRRVRVRGRPRQFGPHARPASANVGAASGAWRTWRRGLVDRLIRLDGEVYPGFSGAPGADAAGRALGIATSALTRIHGVVLPWKTVDRVLGQLHSRAASSGRISASLCRRCACPRRRRRHSA